MTPLPWIILALAVMFALTPRWTRPDLYFAITVRPDFVSTPQARTILRQYWLEVALHTLISLGLLWLIGMKDTPAALLALGWQIVGFSWALARAHRATAVYKVAPDPVREATLSPRSKGIPGGWPFALGPLAILAGAAIYATVAWDQLPPQLPVHWGLRGADRWIAKTPQNVFRFLLLLGSTCCVFLLSAYGTRHWSRRISIQGEAARSESSFQSVVLRLLIGLQYLIVIPPVLLAFRPNTPAPWLWPMLTLAIVVIALTGMIRMGQGGSRLAVQTEQDPPVGDRTPDDAWKWGQFYYNPGDPALIVEKRFGLGYTINFGNRWSWVMMAALLAPAFFSIALR